jgi:3-ketosteroid 9alpha-monooxygenase subunit B
MKTIQRQQYKVIRKRQEAVNVFTLELVSSNPFTFVPGQYITVYFPDSGTPEGKSYSLSSAPHEENFSITVKSMGEFSSRLCSLEKGDVIEASLPYGFFYSESDGNDKVLLASGIGIAPFRSMVLSSDQKIVLHHSIKTKDAAIFKKEFEKLKNVEPHFYFTQEGSPRINPRDVVRNLPDLKSPEFYICGSISFVRDMWNGLKKEGVPEEMIFTEAFFS